MEPSVPIYWEPFISKKPPLSRVFISDSEKTSRPSLEVKGLGIWCKLLALIPVIVTSRQVSLICCWLKQIILQFMQKGIGSTTHMSPPWKYICFGLYNVNNLKKQTADRNSFSVTILHLVDQNPLVMKMLYYNDCDIL